MTTVSTRSTTHWRRIGFVLVAATAVVLMLGTSVTAAKLITGKQIKDGTMTGRDLRNGSVTGADVGDGSLGPADYAGVVVGGVGPQGPAGATGTAGPRGPSGLPAVQGITYVTSERDDLPAGRWTIQTAKCHAGTRALAGGFAAEAGTAGGRLLTSAPLSDGSGWFVGLKNEGSGDIAGGYTWVTCARNQ